ncbi:shikimate dehydrogenase [Dasania sp. GY-MA-18]|uniref:Shikimate dehydrogenase (NADP(+)) n=1 Tax=Dasania phycosphaerae TaxID=2950436 RepID=A0A9J6RQH3_9GAMM|nr:MULTISPECIES: shikimate dehydrogenase [Dasania]MCR8923859.1 shikimate dehydrogenase [Dasania sp. GY-MA-18]MCZ0866293.1 shikimate dehydrogenase [Dasania phycosphaerae]MCZ0870017.1 shikimate dehydrogenase [Dasania phycosphaerae]
MDITDKYAVYGNPIKHSKSPQIHKLFAEQTGEHMVYRSHQVELGKFADAAQSFFDNGGKGLNITLPFKLDAYEFAGQLSDRARLAGAVNTLALQGDGKIYGDNTDGAGMVRDMQHNLGWQIEGKRILLLGAGGAVRGVIEPIAKQNPSLIVVANRTVGKAQKLAHDFAEYGDIRGCSYEALHGNQFDIIINGTSASLAGELPPLETNLLSDEACCYDMMYGAEPTPFMRWSAENMAWAVADGLGMLVEQAAESFCIWRGVRPKTREVIDAMRAQLEG